MEILSGIFGLIFDMLIWCIKWIGIAIAPIILVGFGYAFYYRVIKKRKFPKKKKTVKKYSKHNILLTLKKIYIDFPHRFVLDRLNADPAHFKATGVHLFAGEQGSGKSIAVMHWVKMQLERYPDMKIRSNIDLNFQDDKITDWRSLIFNDNGILGQVEIIDEIQNWFNSNESKNFPVEMLTEITQQRKQAKAIVGTSQVFGRVAKPLREQTTLLYKPMTIAGCFTIVRVYKLALDDSGAVKKMTMRNMYCFVHDDELRNCYDTYQKVKRISVSGFQPRNQQINSVNAPEPVEISDRKD